ncbi:MULTISPECIES: L-serine ammonia-lyase [Pseudoalteromonas]|uniref:L-serine ammonia-lyase n=1 Tax=Pseudoalteromonas TaxID=53246 RepID=UPI00026CBB33|nr:L-serine ammonia-lyase [Pseudoalteromonas spongiae]ATD00682.1 hypothetical protein PSPO_b0709 [Pseudoalteromonas spongiae UST010723-006]
MNSIFEIFSRGFGPSSSHTVGPTRAVNSFCNELIEKSLLDTVNEINIDLYGSLASTGIGHGTGTAIIYGLMGFIPETIDIVLAKVKADLVNASGVLLLNGSKSIRFYPNDNIHYNPRVELSGHPNGIKITASFENKSEEMTRIYYSIGGGFVVCENEINSLHHHEGPFKNIKTFSDIKKFCNEKSWNLSTFARKVEEQFTDNIDQECYQLWTEMQSCIEAGFLSSDSILPGNLKVKRRAPSLYLKLKHLLDSNDRSLSELDFLNLCAMSVNEENAAGNKIITAPTNGAAGVIPSILSYVNFYIKPITPKVAAEFFLIANTIANIYKKNASISGAEVGCQGEVGVASSMAAGALAHILGGSIASIENAAEIAMEHHLGMTCDPVQGLVQIPCIERNAMGAVKALNAARMAVYSPNESKVSLDDVIKTMYETGTDMNSKYKETSEGGLAINVKTIMC